MLTFISLHLNAVFHSIQFQLCGRGGILWLFSTMVLLLTGCSSVFENTTDPESALGDKDGDGWAVCPEATDLAQVLCDCNDQDSSINPDQAERCDKVDTNCDGIVPDDETRDSDNDRYVQCLDCADQEGDANPYMHPGATELCNGLDDNCDGEIKYFQSDADGNVAKVAETDHDGDGYRVCDSDCNDSSKDVYPGAVETCANKEADNNCDTIGGESDAIDASPYYKDADKDGYGDPNSVINACSQPTDASNTYVSNSSDCNDQDPYVHPGAQELCDNIDQDCNGDPQNYFDGDGDGYGRKDDAPCQNGPGWVAQGGDCDDTDPTVYPGASEDPLDTGEGDGKDNNCINGTDEGTDGYDSDSDGWTLIAGDCDDGNFYVHPEAAELCDYLDNDCNNETDEQDPNAGCVWLVSASAECLAVGPPQPGQRLCDGTTWETAWQHPADLPLFDPSYDYGLKAHDEVWLARGTYRATPGTENVLTMVEMVTYRGGFVGNETVARQRVYPFSGSVLDGDTDASADDPTSNDANSTGDATSVVLGATDAVVEGLQIQNGFSDGPTIGAGLLMEAPGTLTVRDCLFLNNATQGHGGGLAMLGGTLSLERTRFKHNLAETGGGVYLLDTSLTVTDGVFEANSANAHGGGLMLGLTDSSLSFSIDVSRTTFFDNLALSGSGGGMKSDLPVLLQDVSFVTNAAPTGHGGGLSLNSVTLKRSTFYQNQALQGEALEVLETGYVATTIFYGNRQSDDDGGQTIWNPSGAGILYDFVATDGETLDSDEIRLTSDPIDAESDAGKLWLSRGEPRLRPDDPTTGYDNPCVTSLDMHAYDSSFGFSATTSDTLPHGTRADPGRRYYPFSLYVNPTAGSAYPDGSSCDSGFTSIAMALARLPGDRFGGLYLCPGTYRPSSPAEPVVSLPSNVWLAGSDRSNTILDGDFEQDGGWSESDSPHVVELRTGNSVSNLTIRGGNGELGGGIHAPDTTCLIDLSLLHNRARQGGGVYLGSSAVLLRTTFGENVATDDGGALFGASPNAQLTVPQGFFYSNQATRGGGIFTYTNLDITLQIAMFNTAQRGGFIYGEANPYGDISITAEGNVWYHRAEEGGSFYCVFCDLTLDGIRILDSQANRGGAISASYGSLNINRSTIEYAIAESKGGAVWGNLLNPLSVQASTLHSCSADEGGALYLENQASLEIESSELSGNSADKGGAISVFGLVTADITHSSLSTNNALEGGAVLTHTSTVSAENTAFSNNDAIYGGAIAAYDSSLELATTNFSYNNADEGGSLLTLNAAGDGERRIAVSDSTFTDNFADEGGAVMSYGSDLILWDNTFAANFSQQGGALKLVGGLMDATNSTLLGNHADEGGALWSQTADISLTNVTVAFNTAESKAAAMTVTLSPYSTDPGGLLMLNTIVYGNQGGDGPSLLLDILEAAHISYSASDQTLPGENNPLLTSAPFDIQSTDGEVSKLFLFQSDNPCIDAGQIPDNADFDWYELTTSRDGAPDDYPVDLGRHY